MTYQDPQCPSISATIPAPIPSNTPGTLPEFTPVPRQRMRKGGWSAERQLQFIHTLAELGSVRAACRQMGCGEHHLYKLRLHPEAGSFRAAWEAALDIGIRKIEDVAMDRALNGVEQPVYHKGAIVGTRRVYNDQLVMFMLRNRAPDRFAGSRARGMSAVDETMLKRLKEQWHEEWEEERAESEQQQVLHAIDSLFQKVRETAPAEEDAGELDPAGDAQDAGGRPDEDAAKNLLLENQSDPEDNADG